VRRKRPGLGWSAALGRHASTDAITRALDTLRTLGRVRCGSAPASGRPAETWEAVE
jgi:hypothetical protein